MTDVREEIARVLTDACDEVDMRLEAFLANPDDVETIHKLRISIRTLDRDLAPARVRRDAEGRPRAGCAVRRAP